MTTDRIEYRLEQMQRELSKVREIVGRLEERIQHLAPAADHASVRADVRRLWWGVGIMAPAIVTALLGAFVG